MIEKILETIGLDPKEAQVYEYILKKGESTVGELARKTELKRGDLYNVLERLKNKKVIAEVTEKKVKSYVVTDPESLEDLALGKKTAFEDAVRNLSQVRSLYNLTRGRPGVTFYEGIEGIQEVMKGSLEAKTEILSFEDIDGFHGAMPEFAKKYEKERQKRKLRERAIVPDTQTARTHFGSTPSPFREQLLVPHKLFPFTLELDIYDNKVFYVTFREPYIAVLIEDKAIADTQRAIFELCWRGAKSGL